MKIKKQSNDFLLDYELLNLFKETCGSEAEYQSVIKDVERAFSFIRRVELKRS